MAYLNITKLRCVKTRDGVGKDEVDIYLAIDGEPEEFVSGAHLMDKSKNDEVVNPSVRKLFHERAEVRLKERNGGQGGPNDLDLGSDTFGPSPQEARDIVFSGNNGRVVYTATIGVSA
ncbi:hypothetical protein [Actinoplanes sp. GCM10030250]|uniref:hypothetical protein n=1 Tax=Actinoplanes sp. GCM10030250 TaxID=3273376 RepID=UPI003607B457